MDHHAEILRRGIWRPRAANWQDVLATALLVATIVLLGLGARQMLAPFMAARQPEISLSPAVLPVYALRTTVRMLAALVASFTFTFTYATLAAKSRRAETVLIPLLDVLQSVPVLGYLSFTVVFFVSLFPGSILGPELAAIFAIFTSQAWNMAFSFFQALRALIFLSGVLLFIAGVAIVRVHNCWTPDWSVLVTALGWLAVASGIARMLFPIQLGSMAEGLRRSGGLFLASALVLLAVGAFVSFKAYGRD
jgi:hypothetical protein